MRTPKLEYDDRLDQNYEDIRHEFEYMLVEEGGYVPIVAQNCDDGRDEFTKKEYNIYLKD